MIAAALFVLAALAVWAAGVRLATAAEEIATRTGIGSALLGMLLLGAVTSLPEVATTITASLRNEASLAVNNLLGGVALQVTILAMVDFALRDRALTSIVARPVVLLQATFSILLLALVAAGAAIGDVDVFGAGAWSTAVFAGYVVAIWAIHGYERRDTWHTPHDAERDNRDAAEENGDQRGHRYRGISNTRLYAITMAVSLTILVAGYTLTRTAETLAEQTGLGTSFFGAVFLALSTSLPELSTALAALRLGRVEMAFADAFGANLFDTALLFVVDVVYPGGPVLGTTGTFSLVAAMLGIVLTAIMVAGLLERRDRAVLRLGVDSWLVLLTYIGGLVLLYRLR